jgi:hypothetical protein
MIAEGGAAHFTTLIDVNQFIVNFYEFVLSTLAATQNSSCARSSRA